MKNEKIACHALCAAVAAACAAAVAAEDWTWGGGNGTWDSSSANWDRGAWVDDEASPNNAVFAPSAQASVTLSGSRFVNDVTVGGGGVKIGGSGVLNIAGTLTANAETRITSRNVAIGGSNGLRIAGSKMVYMLGTNTCSGGTYLGSSNFIVLDQDYQLGIVPETPEDNIFVTGENPGIFAQGAFSVNSNRTIRLQAGKSLRLGAGSGQTMNVRGVISAPDSEGLDRNTDTLVTVFDGWKGWSGLTVFAPGDSRTNSFGRLLMYGHLRIGDGVTRLGFSTGGKTGENAMLYVKNVKTTSFDSSWGVLEVAGGELAAPGRVYVDVSGYGQVKVSGGGKVYMPDVEWLNGLSTPGRLSVENGEFTVRALRLSQSPGSEVYLGEGGLICADKLFLDSDDRRCDFRFDGGFVQARSATGKAADRQLTYMSTNDVRWAGTTFRVMEKGAGFDTGNGKVLFWGRPLESGVEGGADGGVRKVSDGICVFMTANFYTGPTSVEGGTLQVRADNALPPGSTLRLSNGAKVELSTLDNDGDMNRHTTQWLSRVEGDGVVNSTLNLHVTNAVAPAVDGVVKFQHDRFEPFDLRGDFEIVGNSNGCSRVSLDQIMGQDISTLTLKVADFGVFDVNAPNGTYTILDAPGGYIGKFRLPEDWPDEWKVRYLPNRAFLHNLRPTMLIYR